MPSFTTVFALAAGAVLVTAGPIITPAPEGSATATGTEASRSFSIDAALMSELAHHSFIGPPYPGLWPYLHDRLTVDGLNVRDAPAEKATGASETVVPEATGTAGLVFPGMAVSAIVEMLKLEHSHASRAGDANAAATSAIPASETEKVEAPAVPVMTLAVRDGADIIDDAKVAVEGAAAMMKAGAANAFDAKVAKSAKDLKELLFTFNAAFENDGVENPTIHLSPETLATLKDTGREIFMHTVHRIERDGLLAAIPGFDIHAPLPLVPDFLERIPGKVYDDVLAELNKDKPIKRDSADSDATDIPPSESYSDIFHPSLYDLFGPMLESIPPMSPAVQDSIEKRMKKGEKGAMGGVLGTLGLVLIGLCLF